MSTSNGDRKVWAYRRENGRVGVRNHVVILPVDDISNAACEAVANNIKGTIALPHAYGRLQFGEDLDLHFRTMIGTGRQPQRRRGRGHRHRAGLDQEDRRRHRQDRQAGRRLLDRAERRPQDDHDASRKAKEFVHWATELQREECPSELWVSTKCGESDTTTGLGSCPTVGNMYDKLIPHGIYGVFGETSEITGAEHICARAATPEVGEKFMVKMWKAYQDEVIEPTRPPTCPTASRPRATSRAG
jgi:(2R)-sulfolactate sulfo-lyase subunit beta